MISNSTTSTSSDERATHAELRLAEIKARNAEAQKRRRKRLRDQQRGASVPTNKDSSHRRQQNVEAQRRRRVRMKENKEGACGSNSLKAGSFQVALKEPPLLRRPPRSVEHDDNWKVRQLGYLCDELAKMPNDDLIDGILISEAYRRIYARIFGPGRSFKEQLSHNNIIADYLAYERARMGFICTGSSSWCWSSMPDNMLPTKIQVAYPNHPTFIDLLPWPSFRDRLVLLSQDEAGDLLPFSLDLLQHPRLTGKNCPFVIRADPVHVHAWEIAEWFFERNRCLFDQDMLENTNLQRILRGDSLLLVDSPRLLEGVSTSLHGMMDTTWSKDELTPLSFEEG